MNVHHLQSNHSILNHFVAEIRDVQVQKDAMRFRRNIERIGEILAYEISKKLSYNLTDVTTPLGNAIIHLVQNQPVILSVLRAGLPMHQGILNVFDKAENAFISAYRHHTNPIDFTIKLEYFASPNLDDKTIIIADPMLATGKSLKAVVDVILERYKPKQIHIASVIASKQGISFIEQNFPKNTTIWVAAIDEHLNNKGYIVPGLGDAGDLAFGVKL